MISREKKSIRSLSAQYLEIIAVVSSYWVVSISMVFLNKKLLSGKDINLNAPLFVTFYQCLCSAIICVIAAVCAKFNKKFRALCPVKLEFKAEILIQILPLSIIFVGMITFNNLCLKYVGVAFYFVGRSLTTVFNVALTYIVLGQKTSIEAMLCCFTIIVGFFLGVDQENESSNSTLSLLGVAYGVLASLFVSLNAIQTKKVLPSVNNSVWLLNFYNNINSIMLLMLLMVITGELPIVASYEKLSDSEFWMLMTLSGIFGFAIGFVTGLQIQVTSALTHNISGTAKACAQTVLAVIYFSEIKTILWWISNILVLAGSAAYARVRQLEMQAHHDTVNKRLKSEDEESLLELEEVETRP